MVLSLFPKEYSVTVPVDKCALEDNGIFKLCYLNNE